MESPILPSRVAAFPEPIRTKNLSRLVSSCWATRTDAQYIPNTAARGAAPNGAYAVFRKLHTRIAAFRQPLRQRAKSRSEEKWLAAKIVGRWPSGARLALRRTKWSWTRCRPQTQQHLHVRRRPSWPQVPLWLTCSTHEPTRLGHHRRTAPAPHDKTRPRYRPHYPGVQEDDGVDRGLLFAFLGAHLDRQFEFIQKEWANDGKFVGAPAEKDPLVSLAVNVNSPYRSSLSVCT